MTGPLAVQAAAESVSRQLAFPGAPPAWVVVLVIVPLLVLFVSAIYRREGESASPRAGSSEPRSTSSTEATGRVVVAKA